MLAYAASRPVVAQRNPSPNAMLAIIAAHVAVMAVVMSAKMDLPDKIDPTRTIVDLIREPQPPPPTRPVEPTVKQQPIESTVIQPEPQVPLPPAGGQIVDSTPAFPDPGPIIGPSVDPGPRVDHTPLPRLVKLEARLLTPVSELKPPYPESKLVSGEEALLRLRLTIDERGRVVAVEPIGRADSTFLVAARRHLMAHWRYRPASEDGRAVTSTTVITLRFELDG